MTGGTAAAQFDTNGFLIPNTGAFADMFGIFDFKPALTTDGGIPGCTTPAGGFSLDPSCWENRVSDPIEALAVPEPGTVGSAGFALLGVGLLVLSLASP